MNSNIYEEDYSNQLLTWILRRPVIERAISSLSGLTGRGLDLGCGIGLTTRLLDELSSNDNYVVGLDISPSCIETACTFNSKSNTDSRVQYQVGDVLDLQWDRHVFDWAGCIDLAGMKGLNPRRMLGEMARVVKPGGTVFVLNWSGQLLLPGYPVLEARLNQTTSGIAPFMTDMNQDLHISRALGWFDQLLFTRPSATTIAGTVSAPLDEATYQAMSRIISMRWCWSVSEKEIGFDMYNTYQDLCNPDSSEFILKRPDYYGFFTYSLFHAHTK